ncbi:MAG: hypothetical protein WAW41_00240, partial [Methylobacter sp.]
LAPSPAGEGWGDDCTDAGGRAAQGAVAEENKNNHLYPLIPTFSLKGEGAGTCVDTYALVVIRTGKNQFYRAKFNQ